MESPSQLRGICQMGKEKDPAWYFVHRRVSIYLTWLFLHTQVMPNQISFLMMLVGCIGLILVSSVQLQWNLIGFCLLYLAFLLDKVDGEIARYRRAQSVQGILLDRLYHRLVEPSIFLAVAYREYQITASVSVLIAGLVAILLANIIEEHQLLSPFILFKYLREVRKLPETPLRKASPGLSIALVVLKPLKGFRMFIVVLPLLALVYGVEWITGWPMTQYYLYISVAALTVYLLFQCYYYFVFKLEEEIALIGEYFQSGGNGDYGSERRRGVQTMEKEKFEAKEARLSRR